MQLRQIEVFYAVMTTGSTTAAADVLGVTQPSVSMTLARMQDELKLRLFDRRSGRLVPTAEAEILFRQARALKEDADALRRTARRLANGSAGEVRLGVVPALGEDVVARALADLSERFPEVDLSLDVTNSHELLHRLRTGRLDLVAVFGVPEGPGVEIAARLDCPVLCALPDGWDGPPGPVGRASLRGGRVALMGGDDPVGEALLNELGGAASEVIQVRTGRAAVAMARAGICIGIADAVTIGEMGMAGRSRSFDPACATEVAIVREPGRPAIATAHVAERLAEAVRDALAMARQAGS